MNFGFFFSSFFLSIIMVFMGAISLIVQRFHFLMSLISLEFMVLGLFLLLFSVVSFGYEGYLCFIVLSFASCEAALGLGLLVSLVRSHGSDFISIVSLYEC
uniref:NADH-ubiquinone oxidoreductase chain 4L n=1 Tax=Gononemertes parasita TaxID=649615 RepID=A0A075CJS8_9BILA|nr:NADH dehydrogenase subunit 4L [Gononemertes parasita]AGZ63891.1 NADH dehydrogenase subunit 4L [Gononemertes parasita]